MNNNKYKILLVEDEKNIAMTLAYNLMKAGYAYDMLGYFVLTNLILAIFNMLPVPPLDGYHVVNDLIFKGRFNLSRKAFQIGMIVVLLLSYKGVLGDIIYAVVLPAQRLLLMPVAAIWG